MNIVNVVLIVSAGIINAAGSSVMKYAMTYRAAPGAAMPVYWLLMAGAMVLYGGCFPLFAIGLSRSRLSVAQPVFSATSYVAIALVALLFFKEAFVPVKAAGLAVIILGMVLVVA
jgi:multidrug transporter EmrE-like cation transporter